MGTSITVCIVARDDSAFLRRCIAAATDYADELVVIDNGSTDGSWEWLNTLPNTLGIPVKLVRAPVDTLRQYGYSHMKNLAAGLASCDWIHSLDADEALAANQRPLLKDYLSTCKMPVVGIVTMTYHRPENLQSEGWDWIAANVTQVDPFTHRRIYLRKANIQWRGYIHEELYLGNANAMSCCVNTDFKHWHFTNFRTWGDPQRKNIQYSWMLMNAFNNPTLRTWTNSWWYDTWVPEHKAELEERAKAFEALIAEGQA